ncbi:hypothetical protein FB157_1448 [Streptomyces sp. BK340]|nr:hypothetical protein FB157_1448 [Streptomyces sp. BK340]
MLCRLGPPEWLVAAGSSLCLVSNGYEPCLPEVLSWRGLAVFDPEVLADFRTVSCGPVVNGGLCGPRRCGNQSRAW